MFKIRKIPFLKTFLAAAAALFIMLGLISCDLQNEVKDKVVLKNNTINIVLPENWEKSTDNLSEVKFFDEKKNHRGGVFLVSYYHDQPINSSLPNHSKQLSLEDIDTPLGKGKLVVLDRSYPVAANQVVTWQEIHTLIPIKNKELAYDSWIIVDNSIKEDKLLMKQILSQSTQI